MSHHAEISIDTANTARQKPSYKNLCSEVKRKLLTTLNAHFNYIKSKIMRPLAVNAVSFLHLTATSLAFEKYFDESNIVYKYSFPELTRDILERIQLATGQPINTKRLFPILASSSKSHETIEHRPHMQYNKYFTSKQKEAFVGGRYHTDKGEKSGKHEKDHYYFSGEKGFDNQESEEQEYGDQSNLKHKYHEGRFFKKNHHKSNEGKKEGNSKTGRRHGKFNIEKGFRDIYHKDEEKKSDFFWNNQQEEGKWIEYGFKNKKSEKKHDKGEEKMKEKDKMEQSSYEKKENNCSKCKTR